MNYKILAIFMIFAAMMFLVVGCSDEKEDTPTQTTGICMNCHGDNGDLQENVQAFKVEWMNSIHASDITLNRNGIPCAGCHTNQGFYDRTIGGWSAVEVEPNPAPIHCFTCHAPHTNFNFDLRTKTPVPLLMGGTFDLGNGNLCANCHQARVPNPSPGSDSTITSSHWGPHDAAQANDLAGVGAYIFNGDGTITLDTNRSDGYNGGVNSVHSTLATNGCPMCHMATPFSDRAGGHQMGMTYESGATTRDLVTGCNQTGCHSGVTNFDYLGRQDSVEVLLSTLGLALSSAGLFDPAADSVSHPITPTPYQRAALYNYLYAEMERSLGVHNYKYVRDVLEASIAALAAREL